MRTPFTEPTQEIKLAFLENDVVKYETNYFPEENRKEWSIITRNTGTLTYTQFFDMKFFKNGNN